MPAGPSSALTAALILKAKTAMQIPFDTFVYFPGTVILNTEHLAVLKNAAPVPVEYAVDCYKVEDTKLLTAKLQGLLNTPTEKVLFNPRNLATAGLMGANGKAIIDEATSLIEYEGVQHEIDKIQHIGWFDGEYMLIIIYIKSLAPIG